MLGGGGDEQHVGEENLHSPSLPVPHDLLQPRERGVGFSPGMARVLARGSNIRWVTHICKKGISRIIRILIFFVSYLEALALCAGAVGVITRTLSLLHSASKNLAVESMREKIEGQ